MEWLTHEKRKFYFQLGQLLHFTIAGLQIWYTCFSSGSPCKGNPIENKSCQYLDNILLVYSHYYLVNSSVLVRVADISWEGSENDVNLRPRITHVPFINETVCSCKCKHDSSVCNRFQYWDEQHCKCKCNGYCLGNFESHPEKCCTCPAEQACSKKQVWSWDKCSCLCKKKKPCKQEGKIRDKVTCKCRCPLIYCRYGSGLDEKTCQCQSRN